MAEDWTYVQLSWTGKVPMDESPEAQGYLRELLAIDKDEPDIEFGRHLPQMAYVWTIPETLKQKQNKQMQAFRKGEIGLK